MNKVLTAHFRVDRFFFLVIMNDVVLQSSSGARYTVSRQVAALSATIAAMCEGRRGSPSSAGCELIFHQTLALESTRMSPYRSPMSRRRYWRRFFSHCLHTPLTRVQIVAFWQHHVVRYGLESFIVACCLLLVARIF